MANKSQQEAKREDDGDKSRFAQAQQEPGQMSDRLADRSDRSFPEASAGSAQTDRERERSGERPGERSGERSAERSSEGRDERSGESRRRSSQLSELRAGAGLTQRTPAPWDLNPFSWMMQMSREMDRLMDSLWGGSIMPRRSLRGMAEAANSGTAQFLPWVPQLQVDQRDKEIVVRADLPGVRSEDVQVEVRQGSLCIQGERRDGDSVEEEGNGGGYQHLERSFSRFRRVIALPKGVDVETATARMQDGVLEVRVPLPAEEQTRRIEVRGETPGR